MDDVERAISFIVEQLGTSREEAKKLLHRYICKGLCDWYRKRGKLTEFSSVTITERQTEVLRIALEKFVLGESIEDKVKRAHQYLCPGEPCSI